MSLVQALFNKTINVTVPSDVINGADVSSVYFTMGSNGIASTDGGTLSLPQPWITPNLSTARGAYYVRATVLNSGAGVWSGTFDTWQATTSDRLWEFSSLSEEDGGSILVELSKNITGTLVVSSGIITINLFNFGGGGGLIP